MDGNGRWAKKRYLPRVAGHSRGSKRCVESRARLRSRHRIPHLFAFSSENWRRPADEVSTLKQLFRAALEQEADGLHDNKVR